MLRKCALMLACGLLAGCGDRDAPQPHAGEAVPVEVVRSEPLSQAGTVSGTGRIAREREQALSFRWQGVVRTLAVDDGDRVRAGQVLAQLDATGVAARLAQAQADRDKAARDLDRDAALAKNGWISPQRLADRRTALAQAQAALDSARFDLRWASLATPVPGIVLQRHVEPGAVVAPGQPVLTIADETSPLVLRLPLADRDAVRVRRGQPVQIAIEALDASVTGSVSRVGEQADSRTGTVMVEVRLPRQDGLKSGLVANAMVTVDAAPATAGRWRVPAEAIVEADGARATVFTVAGGKTARKVAVAFEGFDGDWAIVTGLAAGAQVITRGGAYVRDGGPVTFAARPPAAANP